MTEDEANRIVANLADPEFSVGRSMYRVMGGTKLARHRGPGEWWWDVMNLTVQHRLNLIGSEYINCQYDD